MGTERRLLALALSVALAFVPAVLGAAATTPNVPNWYAGLAKPAWTPPSWLFGPVWTALYLMMALAAWRVWIVAGLPRARGALSLYAVQLGLNALWSPVFFAAHRTGLALLVIVALVLVLAAAVRMFLAQDRLAGWLLVPYLLWVLFATALNAAIWRLNA